MKKFKLTALALSAVMLLCACSGTQTETSSADIPSISSDTTKASETSEKTTETITEETTVSADETAAPSIAPEEMLTIENDDLLTPEQRLNIIKSSLMLTGSNGRLQNALAKAARGEEITVAYIGGSITEGLTAGSDYCWARYSYEWLCKQFPNTKINFNNAGLSGTPSYLGAVRCERDILDKGIPDIVFVEFAVNDGQDDMNKRMYESLVRNLLELDSKPAVCLLFTVLENGYTCQEHMSKVGEFYGLPMISLPNSLTPAFDSKALLWTTYSDDQSHPNFWGHKLVAEFVDYLFATVISESGGAETEISPLPTDYIYNGDLTDIHFVDSLSITPTELGCFSESTRTVATFLNGWQHMKNTPAAIKFELEFKDLFVVFNCNNNKKYAAVDVYIDGELVENVNSCRDSGWGNPEAELVYESDVKSMHTIEIIPDANSENLFFGLLGLGYTD